jgi:hypothetical protein
VNIIQQTYVLLFFTTVNNEYERYKLFIFSMHFGDTSYGQVLHDRLMYEACIYVL